MVEKLAPISGKKPVIGLAGFFGYGNFGDELFVSVYKEFFEEKFDLCFLADQLRKPYYSRPIEEIVRGVDGIVIGGGDIVQPWGMDQRYFHRAFLEKPVFVAGVGVPIRSGTNKNSHQSEKEWIVEKYRNFFSHPSVKLIHARDPQSRDWIVKKTAPSCEVVESPDIVCALTLPEATRSEAEPVLGIVTRKRPDKEDDYRHIIALAEQQIARGWKVRHIILGTGEVGERDFADAEAIDVPKEVVYTESLEELSRSIGECTALVSMKFHGTVVATMYGVPSTVLIPTNKNRNFMKRMGREDLLSRYDDVTLSARFDPCPERISDEMVARLRNDARAFMTRLVDQIASSI